MEIIFHNNIEWGYFDPTVYVNSLILFVKKSRYFLQFEIGKNLNN